MRASVALVALTVITVSCSPGGAADTTTTSSPDPVATVSTTPPPATTSTVTASGEATSCPAVEPGIGDSLFPTLGNVGYDVDLYELELEFEFPDDITVPRTFAGQVTIHAAASEGLSAFNLDAIELDVTGATVNELAAQWCAEGRELTIVPAEDIASGAEFTVTVEYSGFARPRSEITGWQTGLLRAGPGLFAIDEPDGASSWFPSNDHPLDRALFHLIITVPAGRRVVSAGELVSVEEGSATSTYEWQTAEPMPTYLLPFAIGSFDEVEAEGPDGLPLTFFYEEGLGSSAQSGFGQLGRMVETFEGRFGPYPFSRAGAIVVGSGTFIALETQTLPTYTLASLETLIGPTPVIAHELAHQWFGDWVAVADWNDIWLNEGFATFAEYLWVEEVRGVEEADAQISFDYMDFRRLMEQQNLPPPAEISRNIDLFNPSVYIWGGFTLVALRDEVGDEAFFDLLQTWVERYGGSNVTTEDFLALVEEKLGSDARDLVRRWLFSQTLPPLPARGLPLEGGEG